MGVWERVYSGNLPENSKWRTKETKRLEEEQFVRRCCGYKCQFLLAVPQMTSTFLEEQSPTGTGINKVWNAPGRKSIRYHQMLLQSVSAKCRLQSAGWVQNAD